MSEVLYNAIYDHGDNSYVVEKNVTPQQISVVTYEIYTGHRIENSKIIYKNIGEEYRSPFLSWYNLIFCSNNYGPSPDYSYMHAAVQEGKKTAATVYLEPNSPEGKTLVKNLPSNCAAIPYDSMIFVYHKGRLSDLFDLDHIRSIYLRHGIHNIDWDFVRSLFAKEISFFGKEKDCGFNLQCCGVGEEYIITGLLLGYPVESTIASMLGTTYLVPFQELIQQKRQL